MASGLIFVSIYGLRRIMNLGPELRFMKRRNSVFILLVVLIVSACSRSAAPGVSVTNRLLYDTTAFNLMYGEGLKQKLIGNIGDAINCFEQCIRINPKNDAPYFQIAQISGQRGDLQNAKKYCRVAARIDSGNVWYLSLLGDIYFQEKEIDSAIVCYRSASTRYPENDGLKVTLANYYAEKGDFESAENLYSLLEQKYGVGGNITVLSIRCLINLKKNGEAEEKILKVLKNNPDDLLYNGILAELYRSTGERDKAQKIYEKLLDIDSTNVQTISSLTDFLLDGREYEEVMVLLNGIVINDKFSRDDVLGIFSKVISNTGFVKEKGDATEILIRVLESSYKNDGLVLLIRPELYKQEGRPDVAVKRLEDIVNADPSNYPALEQLMVLYSDIGDYNRLFEIGKKASSAFNMSYPVKVLYASAAMQKKEYNIALEQLEKAKILAGNQDELLTQVLSMEADVYYRKKEFARSFELFREVLRKNPEDMIVLNNYAYYLAEQNQDLKEAERMIRIVINKEKDNSTYLDTFAWVLYKRGKLKDAAKIMEELMDREKKEDTEWFEHYGFIMKAMGDCKTAKVYLQKALNLDSSKEYISKEIESCTK